ATPKRPSTPSDRRPGPRCWPRPAATTPARSGAGSPGWRLPVSPDEITAVRARAEAGDAEALAFTAVLASLGAGEPQSWDVALDRLRRAAAAGSAQAAGQLAVIGPDVRPWFFPPAKERLCHAPRASAVRGFLSPAACDWLIGRARGRTARAQVFDAASGAAA